MINSEMDCAEICTEMSQIRRQLKDWITENGDNLYVQNLLDALKVAANKAFNGVKFESSVRPGAESEDSCYAPVPVPEYQCLYVSNLLFHNKLNHKNGDYWSYFISVGNNCFQDLETQKMYTEMGFDSINAEKLKLPTPYELFSGKFKFKCDLIDACDGVTIKELSCKFKNGKFIDNCGISYYPDQFKSVTIEGPID